MLINLHEKSNHGSLRKKKAVKPSSEVIQLDSETTQEKFSDSVLVKIQKSSPTASPLASKNQRALLEKLIIHEQKEQHEQNEKNEQIQLLQVPKYTNSLSHNSKRPSKNQSVFEKSVTNGNPNLNPNKNSTIHSTSVSVKSPRLIKRAALATNNASSVNKNRSIDTGNSLSKYSEKSKQLPKRNSFKIIPLTQALQTGRTNTSVRLENISEYNYVSQEQENFKEEMDEIL